jgi:REP element-mobilizing transposase RayT
MAGIVGYMVTWTTYGTWLQGDRRGYVKNGQILPPDEKIKTANRKLQRYQTITLTKKEREIIRRTIFAEASGAGHTIHVIAVCSNHVNLVAEPCRYSIEQIISRYKNKEMFALRKLGRSARLWTKGFDKRFCFTKEDLAARVAYVQKHND